MTKSVLVVGLGNPGKQYAKTRHNLGFMVVEKIANSMSWSWQEDKRYTAKRAKGIVQLKSLLNSKESITEVKVELLLPLTYMNLSGPTVKQYASDNYIALNQVVVICDDVDLPFTQLRVRKSGSSGGHNGLKSLIDSFGSQEFTRLRMGVGRPLPEEDLADYVLSEFSQSEVEALDSFIEKGESALLAIIQDNDR